MRQWEIISLRLNFCWSNLKYFSWPELSPTFPPQQRSAQTLPSFCWKCLSSISHTSLQSAWDGWWRSELGDYCKSQHDTRSWKPHSSAYKVVGFFPSPKECSVFSSLRSSISGAGIASPQECPLLRAVFDTSILPIFTVKIGSLPGQKSSLAVWAHSILGNRAVAPAGTSSLNQKTNQENSMCLADVRFGPDARLLDSFKNLFSCASSL